MGLEGDWYLVSVGNGPPVTEVGSLNVTGLARLQHLLRTGPAARALVVDLSDQSSAAISEMGRLVALSWLVRCGGGEVAFVAGDSHLGEMLGAAAPVVGSLESAWEAIALYPVAQHWGCSPNGSSGANTPSGPGGSGSEPATVDVGVPQLKAHPSIEAVGCFT
jgi:hypothetical protein